MANRNATAAQWTSSNIVLALGEYGYESDTGKSKIGDGSTAWNTLVYTGSSSALFSPTTGSDNWLKAWAANIDQLIRSTSITRDANGAATSASVVWPDGTGGTYTGTASVSFLGAIDSYSVTYLGSTTRTVTQSAVTRDSSGNITNKPAMGVS